MEQSVAEQLREASNKCNKFGDAKDRERAREIYSNVIIAAFEVADQTGDMKVEFGEEILPRECVAYFKYLCECDGIAFKEKIIQDTYEVTGEKNYKFTDKEYKYVIDWSGEE